MNVNQALQVLEMVRRKFQGTGMDHDTLHEALEVLSRAVLEHQTQDKEPDN